VAIRIPNHQFYQDLLRVFGKPIVSTSANISGEPTVFCFDEIVQEIKDCVDYIVLISTIWFKSPAFMRDTLDKSSKNSYT
jgi:L-threonylcarbamoyladenylate synthase